MAEDESKGKQGEQHGPPTSSGGLMNRKLLPLLMVGLAGTAAWAISMWPVFHEVDYEVKALEGKSQEPDSHVVEPIGTNTYRLKPTVAGVDLGGIIFDQRIALLRPHEDCYRTATRTHRYQRILGIDSPLYPGIYTYDEPTTVDGIFSGEEQVTVTGGELLYRNGAERDAKDRHDSKLDYCMRSYFKEIGTDILEGPNGISSGHGLEESFSDNVLAFKEKDEKCYRIAFRTLVDDVYHYTYADPSTPVDQREVINYMKDGVVVYRHGAEKQSGLPACPQQSPVQQAK